jgi:hypothetical protein
VTPTTIVRELPADFKLARGGHRSVEEGMCATESVAWLAGEPFTASPSCMSRVLRVYVQRLNDSWNDDERQDLLPYLPRCIGTAATDAIERRRAYLAADWCVRFAVPKAFRKAGLIEEAERLEQLLEVINKETSIAARTALRSAADVARKLRSERRAKLEAKLRSLLGAAWAAWDAGDAGAAWDAGDAGDAVPDKILAAIKSKKPGTDTYTVTYNLVYKEMRPRYDELLKDLRAETHASALDLLGRMILVGQEVA